MKIAVFGTGMVGETIGSKLIELGHAVMMGPRLRIMKRQRQKEVCSHTDMKLLHMQL